MSLRLFFGIACPVLPSITQLQDELRNHRPGLRLVPPQNLHLTLRFLGAVDASSVVAMCEHAKPILSDIGRFEMTLRGVGCFPRALWIGVELPPHIHTLVVVLNKALTGLGFQQAEQGFCPHVTVARLRKSAGLAVTEELKARYADFHFGRVSVDAVHLYSSEPGPDGVVYRAIHNFT